ncbi:MAG: bacterial transcriptional activator domain-containing protein [Caldilineaceae bacterium]
MTRQTVRFNADNATVDVLRFQEVLAAVQKSAALDLDQLEAAATLYRGELLTGFGVDDAPPFEEWLFLHRELLHQQALLTFHTLTTTYERSGHYERAYSVTDRLLTLDPYREESYRQRMRLLAHLGHPEQALQQLEQLRHCCARRWGGSGGRDIGTGQADRGRRVRQGDRRSTQSGVEPMG